MENKREKLTIKTILLTLAFLAVTGIILVTIGNQAGVLALTKINMAVDLGSPVYEYTAEGSKPSEGEVTKNEINTPSVGSKYGALLCDRINLKAPLYYGDSDDILSEGAGQYAASGFPGEGKPILIGAHDMGYFDCLEDVKKGDVINLNTSYGEFEYKVTSIEVKGASSIGRSDLESDKEELILYTCYPFGAIGQNSDERFFVTAEKISGPVFVEK